MDGNFSAEHVKMKKPGDDVALADGHGYFVTDADYKSHLKVASDAIEVCIPHLGAPVSITYSTAFDLQRSPGGEPIQCEPQQPGGHRHGSLCMHSPRRHCSPHRC